MRIPKLTMTTLIGTGLGKSATGAPLLGIFSGSSSSAMKTVERAAAEVAPTELPIFIVGESGTGKGTLATMIHRLSRRCDQELVKINCASLPRALVTEASVGRSPLGLSTRQLRGTVLLDEVLELPHALQSHVMAILPEGDIESNQPRIAPRIIAATRSDDGRPLSGSPFARELYYRLRGVLLRIPPLRERREDIPLLAHFLVNKYASTFGRSSVRLSARVEEQFQRHMWPGNIRELENAIKTLLALDDEDVALEGIGLFGSSNATPASSPSPENSGIAGGSNGSHNEAFEPIPAVFSLKQASRTASRIAEKQMISEVLQRTSWNRKRAAKELNISYKALLYKLKQCGLSSPKTEDEPLGRGR